MSRKVQSVCGPSVFRFDKSLDEPTSIILALSVERIYIDIMGLKLSSAIMKRALERGAAAAAQDDDRANKPVKSTDKQINALQNLGLTYPQIRALVSGVFLPRCRHRVASRVLSAGGWWCPRPHTTPRPQEKRGLRQYNKVFQELRIKSNTRKPVPGSCLDVVRKAGGDVTELEQLSRDEAFEFVVKYYLPHGILVRAILCAHRAHALGSSVTRSCKGGTGTPAEQAWACHHCLHQAPALCVVCRRQCTPPS